MGVPEEGLEAGGFAPKMPAEVSLMSPHAWLALTGSVAALCTTVAFVPQIVKIWRQGGRDLSYGMLLLYLVGVLLWLIYGLLIHAREVILANLAAIVLVGAAIALKWALPGSRVREGPAGRPRIAIDMDEVMADTLAKQLRVYSFLFGSEISRDALKGRSLWETIPADHAETLRQLVHEPTFFRDLDVVEGCREVVEALMERYEVYVASAAMEVPTSFGAKYDWLRQHFPFIDPSHIVFCGDKAVLDVEYLVDDTPRHFVDFRGKPILFSAPHNAGEERYLRMQDWSAVRRFFLEGPQGAGLEGTPEAAALPSEETP